MLNLESFVLEIEGEQFHLTNIVVDIERADYHYTVNLELFGILYEIPFLEHATNSQIYQIEKQLRKYANAEYENQMTNYLSERVFIHRQFLCKKT